jgi:hypothetical protein
MPFQVGLPGCHKSISLMYRIILTSSSEIVETPPVPCSAIGEIRRCPVPFFL